MGAKIKTQKILGLNTTPHATFLLYLTWLHFVAEICGHYHESSDCLNTKKIPT